MLLRWCGRIVKHSYSHESQEIDKRPTVLLSDMTDFVPSAAAHLDNRHELEGRPRKPSEKNLGCFQKSGSVPGQSNLIAGYELDSSFDHISFAASR